MQFSARTDACLLEQVILLRLANLQIINPITFKPIADKPLRIVEGLPSGRDMAQSLLNKTCCPDKVS
jgi:hypothetical protein